MSATKELDALIERLERIVAQAGQAGDAIDRINQSAERSSRVVSLRDSEVIQRFRDDLINGLIRMDTANQLFGLIRSVLDQLPFLRAGSATG